MLIDYAARWIEGEPVAGDDAVDARFWPLEEGIARVEWATTKKVIRDAWEKYGKT